MERGVSRYSELSYLGKIREDLRFVRLVIDTPSKDAHGLSVATDGRESIVSPNDKGFQWWLRQNGSTSDEIAHFARVTSRVVDRGGRGILGATADQVALNRIKRDGIKYNRRTYGHKYDRELKKNFKLWNKAISLGDQQYPWYGHTEKALRMYPRVMNALTGRLVDATFIFGRLTEEALLDYPDKYDGVFMRSVARLRNVGASVAHLTTKGAIQYSMMRDIKATDDFYKTKEIGRDEKDSIVRISKEYKYDLPADIVNRPFALKRFLASVQLSYGMAGPLRELLGYGAYGAVLATAIQNESLFHRLQQQYGDETVWWLGASVLAGSMAINAVMQAVALKRTAVCHSPYATTAQITGEASVKSIRNRIVEWKEKPKIVNADPDVENPGGVVNSVKKITKTILVDQPKRVIKGTYGMGRKAIVDSGILNYITSERKERLADLTNKSLETIGLLGIGLGEATRDVYISMLPPFVILYSAGGPVTQFSYMLAMAVDNLTFAGINTVVSSKRLSEMSSNFNAILSRKLRPYEKQSHDDDSILKVA